jgi:hypothetical protein
MPDCSSSAFVLRDSESELLIEILDSTLFDAALGFDFFRAEPSSATRPDKAAKAVK